MFEYHGWITLVGNPDPEDETPSAAYVGQVRTLLDRMSSPYLADLRAMNGHWMLHIAGHPNRPGPHGPEIIDLFTEIGRIAPGSYGLLHTYDDEDLQHPNAFRAHRLARGTLTEQPDPFLSPVRPTIEDP